LSYRTVVEDVGNAPTSAMPILFSRQVQPAYICLPSRNGGCAQVPARVGLAPTPNGLTGRRATAVKSQPRKLKGPGPRQLIAVRQGPAHAISTKNKHLLLACAINPRFHGGSFGV